MKLEIEGWEALQRAPDRDGDQHLVVKVTVVVHSEREFDLLRCRALVSTAEGLPVALITEDLPGDYGDGETVQVEADGFLALPVTEGLQADIRLAAARIDLVRHDLGWLPAVGELVGGTRPIEVCPGLVVQRWGVHLGAPDGDGDHTVSFVADVGWTGDGASPRVEVRLRLLDRKGSEFQVMFDELAAMAPGCRGIVDGATWIQSRWAGMRVQMLLEMEAHHHLLEVAAPTVRFEPSA